MTIGKMLRELIWKKTDGHCWYCGKALVWPTNDVVRAKHRVSDWFVVEHIVPRSLGGTNKPENLTPACWTCNGRKGNKSLEEYRLYLTMLTIGVTPFTQDQIDYLLEHGIPIPMPQPLLFWGEETYTDVNEATD